MDSLNTRQKEILNTAIEMFEDSIKVSLLSLEMMVEAAKQEDEFKPLVESGELEVEIQAAINLLDDIEVIKEVVANQMGEDEEDGTPLPEPTWG